MKKKLIRILCVVLCMTMIFSVSTSAYSADEMITKLTKWLTDNIDVSQAGERIDSDLDWTVFALARNGNTDYNDAYRAYIGNAVKNNWENLYLNDYARISLTVMSIGMDATDIGGKNLIDAIEKADFSKESFTGTVAYALIALDAAKSDNGNVKNKIKNILCSAQREDGGYNSYLAADEASYWTASGETDSTGIALQALAPYADEEEIKSIISSATDFIKNEQMDDGGFGAWGSGSAESTSMIIAGLCAIGENPENYVRNGKTPVEALTAYINEDGGGKCWDGSSNVMTSYQMLIGLSSYYRLKENKVGVYDMSCLSPFCNSIEHNAFFEKYPVLGKIVCKIVSVLYFIIGKDYYCCRH